MARMTGAQLLAEMLQGYGVSHVFMVPAVLRRTFAEMERRTAIKRIHTHGEKAAAYMADGYARASGRPGVCMAQVVGALNLAAGLRDAGLARGEEQVPRGRPGSGRHAVLRAGHEVERDRRRGRTISRHGAAGVSHRGFLRAGAGPPAVPRQRGPGGPGRSGHGDPVRTAV